ncbi:hypothetical protein [Streptomyces sp. H27-D2]|uniref:hypothetical protein n=1 Tax=Streptomyces sp. H27-D2 TaxID=3046304 RepID=UPI002DBE9AF6|nr:hypothetical protein [Streptomyces sp. H27-D2]MEC4017207.1 hypothetical protein [Streptomyces sp. H27-D2]
MQQQATQATAPRPDYTAPVDVEQAEAALVEHYPRLVRLAYLVLPPSLGRNRRVLTAHSIPQRALPRSRTSVAAIALPEQRKSGGPEADGDEGADPGYTFVRQRVLRAALDLSGPRRRWYLPDRSQLPPLFPQVWGLRLFPRSGGAEELALDQTLASLSGPGRAAFVLRELEQLTDRYARQVLAAVGVENPRAAVTEADDVQVPAGSRDRPLLESAEFDPCSLQARPTDLMRRRQHGRAALAAGAAVLVCGALLGLPGDGWGPDGAAAPPYAQNIAAQQALDPAELTEVEPAAWRSSARTDFTVWPARGDRVGDKELLRRALAVWARPGAAVQVSATPGTPAGPPAGPPQLLYAGEVDQAAVVLLHDGLRVVRYAEPKAADDAEGEGTGAALDFARTDNADTAASTALIVGRTDGNVRYLLAPWLRRAGVRDLVKPAAAARPLTVAADGVTDPVPSPAPSRACAAWPALQLGSRLVTDLGELAPARLTYGNPSAGPRDVSAGPAGSVARTSWARTACQLQDVRSQGVRTVNAWAYAAQPLPEQSGTALWVCTRADTWRGGGDRVLAQFLAPAAGPGTPGAVVARAEDSPACGARQPRALAGVVWKSRAGNWYVLAAGNRQVASITASGGVRGSAQGHLLAVPAKQGSHAELRARLADGSGFSALH